MTQGNTGAEIGRKVVGGGLESGARKLFFENQIARERKVSFEDVRWMTTSEAAQYLRISNSSIKTMVYRGQIRVHKLGRRNRFLREELDRLITPSAPNFGGVYATKNN